MCETELEVKRALYKKWNRHRFIVRDPSELKLINHMLKKEMKVINKRSDKTAMLICNLYSKINAAVLKLSSET